MTLASRNFRRINGTLAAYDEDGKEPAMSAPDKMREALEAAATQFERDRDECLERWRDEALPIPEQSDALTKSEVYYEMAKVCRAALTTPPDRGEGECLSGRDAPSDEYHKAMEWLDRRELVFAKAPLNYATIIKAELKRLTRGEGTLPPGEHMEGCRDGLCDDNPNPPVVREGWRPIDSAPKDGPADEWTGVKRGPKILLWLPGHEISWVGWWRQNEDGSGLWDSYFSECMGSDAYADLHPSHWRPLPAPPIPSPSTGGEVPPLDLPPGTTIAPEPIKI